MGPGGVLPEAAALILQTGLCCGVGWEAVCAGRGLAEWGSRGSWRQALLPPALVLCVCVCVCLPAHPFLPCEVVSQQPPCHIPDPRGQLVLVGEAEGEQGPGLG